MYDSVYYFDDDEREKADISAIEYARGLYNSQVHKVKQEQYICDLLLEDYVRRIKSYPTRYDYITLFSDAQKQIGKKLKKERQELEALKHFIVDDFLNKDKTFKLTKITGCGYVSYAWNVEFTGYGKTIEITIPVKKNLTTKNLEYAYYGMFGFAVKDSESCWHVLKQSYRIEDIAEYIKGYFKFLDCEKKEEEN